MAGEVVYANYGLPGDYPVVRCQQCEFVYVNPRPTFASLGAHYPDGWVAWAVTGIAGLLGG